MDAALTAMLTETVLHAPYEGQDGYGVPTFGLTQSLPARVQYKVQRITNAQGEERVSRAKVFLDGTVAIGLRDRLTLPDGTQPALQLVYPVQDETGAAHHVEVWV